MDNFFGKSSNNRRTNGWTQFTPSARPWLYKLFSSQQEEYDDDVSKAFTTETTTPAATVAVPNPTPVTTYTAKNGSARRCQRLINKKKNTIRLQLLSPLSSLSGLIPCGVSCGIKVFLTSNERFFLTKNATVKPRFVVKGKFSTCLSLSLSLSLSFFSFFFLFFFVSTKFHFEETIQ